MLIPHQTSLFYISPNNTLAVWSRSHYYSLNLWNMTAVQASRTLSVTLLPTSNSTPNSAGVSESALFLVFEESEGRATILYSQLNGSTIQSPAWQNLTDQLLASSSNNFTFGVPTSVSYGDPEENGTTTISFFDFSTTKIPRFGFTQYSNIIGSSTFTGQLSCTDTLFRPTN